jgi:Nif-specific regulatory protein
MTSMSDRGRSFAPKPPSGAEELRMLLDISQSLHRFTNIDDLLPYVISAAKRLVDVETVSILLHDPSSNELLFRLTEGNTSKSSSILKEIRFPANQGIAGSVFTSGKPELIPDVSRDPRHYTAVDGKTGFTTKSLIAVPLKTRGRIIGVLETCNKRHGGFEDRDLGLMLTIADTIAMAVDNARIHAELQKAYEELRQIDRAKDSVIESAAEENARLRREIEDRYRFDHIKGNSPQMLNLFRICEKVMSSDVTVLIEGETGTGKELIARSLHHNGPRSGKRFVTQNCGGIPESLLASELFGYKRGAFTGAVSDKKGLFEIAHGGTIFLDEVAEMSAAMQVSLLRVLQEGEVRPLGADEVKKVDVRLISATNRRLEEDVKKGLFREDLYYRLSVFTVNLPSLREREGDIPILAEHFIRKFNHKLNKSVKGLSAKALRCLCDWPFPGNVRELENEMERAVVLAENGANIEVSDLSERLRKRLASAGGAVRPERSLRGVTDTMEREMICKSLEEHGGNKSKVARQLGLSRFGLAKKMKRLGL